MDRWSLSFNQRLLSIGTSEMGDKRGWKDAKTGKKKTANETRHGASSTYRNAVGIFLADAFGLSLPLLERVLVLELGSHFGLYWFR